MLKLLPLKHGKQQSVTSYFSNFMCVSKHMSSVTVKGDIKFTQLDVAPQNISMTMGYCSFLSSHSLLHV